MVAWKPIFSGTRPERKTVDLYAREDPFIGISPSGYGRLRSKRILEMESKGWVMIKEENGIGLFER